MSCELAKRIDLSHCQRLPGPGWQRRLEPGTASSPLTDELMLDTSPLTGAAQRDRGHRLNSVLASPLGTFYSAWVAGRAGRKQHGVEGIHGATILLLQQGTPREQ